MIILINGSLGVGKTSVAEELLWKFEKAVHLDGDAIGAVHPFEIYDDERVDHLFRTLELLIRHHRESGYPDFVINYIFETPGQLADLIGRLSPLDPDIHAYRLTCGESEQAGRIRGRARAGLDWELQRYLELNRIQEAAARTGDIGEPVDTTGRKAAEVANLIWGAVHRTNQT